MDEAADPVEERPRERLVRLGARLLTDRELIALVLGHGLRGRAAPEIAARLLERHGGVHGLARLTVGRLTGTAGVGAVQASRVVAAVELGRRTVYVLPRARAPLHSPEDAAQFLLPMFGSALVERLGVVLLDGRHRFLQVHVVSEGTVDRAAALLRDVFREAIAAGAAAVVVFHNHPSGDPAPSPEDAVLTRRLAEAGRLVGIDVLDHLVLADGRYCSLRRARLF
jgi:DNA repair protein RadC